MRRSSIGKPLILAAFSPQPLAMARNASVTQGVQFGGLLVLLGLVARQVMLLNNATLR
jgi:hypothetical protein